MDAGTIPSFAISSLCATTASCAAASLGYSWAYAAADEDDENEIHSHYGRRFHKYRGIARPSSFADYPSFTGNASRPSTALSAQISPTRPVLPRPRSAIVQSTVKTPLHAFADTSEEHHPREEQQEKSKDPVRVVQEGDPDFAQDTRDIGPSHSPALPRRSKSLWFSKHRRTRSASARQSLDAPAQSRSSRPTTSYLHSNNLSPAYLPLSNPAPAPRNRLVKRSTSQHLQNRSSLDGDFSSSSAAPSRPVFRRPATSHQRAIDTHAHEIRLLNRRSSAAASLRLAKDSGESLRKADPHQFRWQPLFQQRTINSARVPRPFTPTNLVSPHSVAAYEPQGVEEPQGYVPSLVMAASVTSRPSVHDRVAATSTTTDLPGRLPNTTAQLSLMTEHRNSFFREDLPDTLSTHPEHPDQQTTRGLAESHDIALASSSPPTPAPTLPTFKVFRRRSARQRTGGSVDNSKLLHSAARSVSDGRSVQTQSAMATERSKHNLARSIGVPYSSVSGDSQPTWAARRSFSLADTKHSRNSDYDLDGASGIDSVHSSRLVPVPSGSRTVSDQGSALGAGSDTDNSRVFSITGEETDTFSDTNFDSLKTGGTNSSSSGTRLTQIESLFIEPDRKPILGGEGLSVLEEKLSEASLSASSRPDAQDGSSPRSGYNDSLNSFRTQRSRAAVQSSLPNSRGAFSKAADWDAALNGSARMTLADAASEVDLDAFWDAPEVISSDESDEAKVFSSNVPIDVTSSAPGTQVSLGKGASPLSNQYDHSDSTGPPASLQGSGSRVNAAGVDLWAFSERNPANTTSRSRPQTVHGRSGDSAAQSRAYRRLNSHHRSYSEPKIVDDAHPFNPDMFDLGKKGASENWDSDFEDQSQEHLPTMTAIMERISDDMAMQTMNHKTLTDAQTPLTTTSATPSADQPIAPASKRPSPIRTPSHRSAAAGLSIPLYITDMQSTVRGQFRAVGELKMLVEELRRLTARAEKLSIEVAENDRALREEATGIIQLADADEIDDSAIRLRDDTRQDSDNTMAQHSSAKSDHSTETNGDVYTEQSSTNMAAVVVENMAIAKRDLSAGSRKANFDTMALKELVARAASCVAALKMDIASAEGMDNEKGSQAVAALREVFNQPQS